MHHRSFWAFLEIGFAELLCDMIMLGRITLRTRFGAERDTFSGERSDVGLVLLCWSSTPIICHSSYLMDVAQPNSYYGNFGKEGKDL